MSEPTSTAPPLTLPAEKVSQDDIPMELMHVSIRSCLSRVTHGRRIKKEKNKK
jgi:hypothetical protein